MPKMKHKHVKKFGGIFRANLDLEPSDETINDLLNGMREHKVHLIFVVFDCHETMI